MKLSAYIDGSECGSAHAFWPTNSTTPEIKVGRMEWASIDDLRVYDEPHSPIDFLFELPLSAR